MTLQGLRGKNFHGKKDYFALVKSIAFKTTSISSLILWFFKYPTISVKITSVSI